ncbi:MAG: hypothetical protein AAFR67_14735 [Chloroflexota bacterium]
MIQPTPHQNMEWIEAIVRWTRYDYVEIYEYPSTDESNPVMTVYTGDMVKVSRKFHRDDWCLCQAGHVLGWVFLKDVKFLVQGRRPRRSIPRPAERMNTNALDTQPAMPVTMTETTETNEVETAIPQAPAQASVGASSGASDEPSSKTSLIKRMIRFFK